MSESFLLYTTEKKTPIPPPAGSPGFIDRFHDQKFTILQRFNTCFKRFFQPHTYMIKGDFFNLNHDNSPLRSSFSRCLISLLDAFRGSPSTSKKAAGILYFASRSRQKAVSSSELTEEVSTRKACGTFPTSDLRIPKHRPLLQPDGQAAPLPLLPGRCFLRLK